jgi:hypothetical protein
MNAFNELNRHALREHRNREAETLERVQAEAMHLERHPEGEESRDPLIVDGQLVERPRSARLRGTLTVRW